MTRAARRKQLLAAAQEVFVAHGYHAAAMDEIAERAGVSKPVLYQHFTGKLDLYHALLDIQADTLVTAVQEALDATTDNRERIHGVLSAYFGFVDRDGHDGAFRLIFESDLSNDPGVRSRVDGAAEKTMRAIATTVAGDTGLDQARAELLATALTGAAQLAASWWLRRDRPVTQDEAVELLGSLIWRGISNFPRLEDAPAD